MTSNSLNAGDWISDEPLDLSMKHNRLEKENFVRGPLVVQPNTMQQSNVVVARLWQTSEVIRSQESNLKLVQQFEKANSDDQLIPNNKVTNAPMLSSIPTHTKRLRFNRLQIKYMEQIFDIKKFLTIDEILETARLLNVKDFQVRNWFQRRLYKWRKQIECSTKFVKILPIPSQETSSSSTT